MRSTILLLGALLGAACSDAGSGPQSAGPCTGPVAVSVSPGTTPRFTWTPACRVFAILVEEEASDRWSLESIAGGIASGVRYGEVPRGAIEGMPPVPLVAGTTYEVILFRGTDDDATIVAIREFTP